MSIHSASYRPMAMVNTRTTSHQQPQTPATTAPPAQPSSQPITQPKRSSWRCMHLVGTAMIGTLYASAKAQRVTLTDASTHAPTANHTRPIEHASWQVPLPETHQTSSTSKPQFFGDWPLYGEQGQPQASDVRRNKLRNSWLLTGLGSMAQQCPHLITDAIRINPHTGQAQVRLYGVQGPSALRDVLQDRFRRDVDLSKPCWIDVSIQDIEDNLKRGGSSHGPIWPALFETALAKALIPKRSRLERMLHGPAELKHGYMHAARPSTTVVAARLLLGQEPVMFDFQTLGQVPGSSPEQRIDRVYDYVQQALQEGCVINAAVMDEALVPYTKEQRALRMEPGYQDGLEAGSYVIEGAHLDDQGEKCIQLRSASGVHHDFHFRGKPFDKGETTFDLLPVDDRTLAWAKRVEGSFSVRLKDIYHAGTMSLSPPQGGFFSWVERAAMEEKAQTPKG